MYAKVKNRTLLLLLILLAQNIEDARVLVNYYT